MTSAEEVIMTSSAGACGFDIEQRPASDHELHSTSIPCDVGGGVVRHTTSGLAARGMTGMSDIAGQSFSRQEQNCDEYEDLDKSSVGDRYLQAATDSRALASTSDDGVTRSLDNDEDTAAAGSRQNLADFSSSERSASSSTAVCRSHMHLRSKTSRDGQVDGDVVEEEAVAATMRRPRRRRTRDVCRPLRHWLYGHRDAPYPSRADKLQLATVTQLSLTQISNWFANARRRLKNTVDRAVAQRYRPATDVDGGGLDWAQRIRLYNRHTVGNQERLSISSDDSDRDDELDDVTGSHDNDIAKYSGGEMANPTAVVGGVSAGGRLELIVTPSDGATVVDADELERLRHRNASGSLSSHDYEEMSTSSASLRSTPTCPLHPHHLAHSPRLAVDFEECADDYPCCNSSDRAGVYDGAMHWKEISAALALTTLANSRLYNRQT